MLWKILRMRGDRDRERRYNRKQIHRNDKKFAFAK